MSLYQEYLKEIDLRKEDGLHPKPIEDGELLSEIINQIKDETHNIEAIQLISLPTMLFLEQQVLQQLKLNF